MMLDNDLLIEHIEFLISLGHRSLSDVTLKDKDKLFAYCINDDDIEWLYDPALLSLYSEWIRTKDVAIGGALLHALDDKITRYYTPALSETFDYTYCRVQQEKKEDANMHPHIDPINGEVTWRK